MKLQYEFTVTAYLCKMAKLVLQKIFFRKSKTLRLNHNLEINLLGYAKKVIKSDINPCCCSFVQFFWAKSFSFANLNWLPKIV